MWWIGGDAVVDMVIWLGSNQCARAVLLGRIG